MKIGIKHPRVKDRRFPGKPALAAWTYTWDLGSVSHVEMGVGPSKRHRRFIQTEKANFDFRAAERKQLLTVNNSMPPASTIKTSSISSRSSFSSISSDSSTYYSWPVFPPTTVQFGTLTSNRAKKSIES